MSYPTQQGTLKKLEDQTRRDGRALEDACCARLVDLWNRTKDEMRGSILNTYRKHFGSDTWDTSSVHAKGTLHVISQQVMNSLTLFHNQASTLFKSSMKDAYLGEMAHQLWMLDMLTPPSYLPKAPEKAKALRESDAPDFKTGWAQALVEYLHAYHNTLITNLRMEALHGGSLSDAADEVDASKIDGFEPTYKLSSALTNLILQVQRDARDDGSGVNQDLVAEEIFQTMEDEAVCPDCSSQDGKNMEDVDMSLDHIFGFNCRCFSRIVPVEFADLLRSGDADEKQAALEMDARGLVPDAMAISDENGRLKAHISVKFADWVDSERGMSIMGRAGSEVVQ